MLMDAAAFLLLFFDMLRFVCPPSAVEDSSHVVAVPIAGAYI
jgi:hypothetical protein